MKTSIKLSSRGNLVRKIQLKEKKTNREKEIDLSLLQEMILI
jgi:hypothetical protein